MQKFAPQDLPAFTKLIQVLAFTLADDGCLPARLRDELVLLASALNEVVSSLHGGKGAGNVRRSRKG